MRRKEWSAGMSYTCSLVVCYLNIVTEGERVSGSKHPFHSISILSLITWLYTPTLSTS
jgi:hypothetical protein